MEERVLEEARKTEVPQEAREKLRPKTLQEKYPLPKDIKPEPLTEPPPVVRLNTLGETVTGVKSAELDPFCTPIEMQQPKFRPSFLKVYQVRIEPCPRRLVEAASPEAAEAEYRNHYQLRRLDLQVSVNEVA